MHQMCGLPVGSVRRMVWPGMGRNVSEVGGEFVWARCLSLPGSGEVEILKGTASGWEAICVGG